MNAILEIIQRWQDPGPWATVKALATQAAELDSQAVKLGGDARFLLDRGDIAAASEVKAEADHLRKCAANVLGQRSELASQFIQIENWVREHRPELLEFVPIAAFSGEPSEAIRDLKRLESRIRKPAAKTPSGHPGHSRNKIPPKDVQEIFRMMKLKRWTDKNPIDVCRAYIKKEHKNASDEDIEKLAKNLKRNLNRY